MTFTPLTFSGLPSVFFFFFHAAHIFIWLLTKVEINVKYNLCPAFLHSTFMMLR